MTLPTLPQHPFGKHISAADLSAKLAAAPSWEAKNRLLVQLAKEIPSLTFEQRSAEAKVSGCESQVWLHIHAAGGVYFIYADSDSKIIKGLLALVLAAFHGKSAFEIQAVDFNAWLDDLGLRRFLSASRGNGLKAIVAAIKSRAV